MSIQKVIYIAGVARSGTSWIGQIFNSLPQVAFRFQPFFSYEFKNQVNEDSPTEEFQSILKKMANTKTDFLVQKDKVISKEYPKFRKDKNKTVLVLKENRYQSLIEPMLRKVPNLLLLGIIRNPCAVINSWHKNEKEFPKGSILKNEWRFANCKNLGNEDYFGFYKWKEVANMYLDLREKYPNRVYILKYEDIVTNPIEKSKEIFDFFHLKMDSQTLSFLDQSTNLTNTSYYSVYKSKDVSEKWKKELDTYIVKEIFEDLKDTRLSYYLS